MADTFSFRDISCSAHHGTDTAVAFMQSLPTTENVGNSTRPGFANLIAFRGNVVSAYLFPE
jgi:hypothetical protein